MQVDVFHRNDLRVPATRCTALDAENGSETRLAQCENNLVLATAQSIRETHRQSRFALAGRSRVDTGDEHELALRSGTARDRIQLNLGFVASIQLEVFIPQVQLGCYVAYEFRFRGLCNGDIGKHG